MSHIIRNFVRSRIADGWTDVEKICWAFYAEHPAGHIGYGYVQRLIREWNREQKAIADARRETTP
jgi:hypothetical protein